MVYEQSPTITYRWREGFPHRGADAQIIGEALDALQRMHGDLTPEAIVEAARKKDSPLYPFIEHNRDKAAIAYRLSQALGLRNAVQRVVVYYVQQEQRTATVQAFVAHPQRRHGTEIQSPYVYVPIQEVMSEAVAREAHIERALQELMAWQRRYQTLQELEGLFVAIDAQMQAMEKRRRRKKEAQGAAD